MSLQDFLDYTLWGYPIAPILIAIAIALSSLVLKNILTTLILKP